MNYFRFISALFLALSVECLSQNYPPDVRDVKIGKTNLPIVFINTLGHEMNREDRVSALMKIVSNPDGVNYDDTIAHPNQIANYEGYIGIKYRGNSSFEDQKKKPYSFKLLTDSYENGGKKLKKALLGMGKDDDWCLLSPYNDRSLIRNVLTFTLAQGYSEFVPKIRLCEVIIDGLYYGVFQLSEKVSRGDDRLNIKKPGDSGDELTGGYVIEKDRDDEPIYHTSKYFPTNSDGEELHFTTDINGNVLQTHPPIFIQYKEPDWEEITEIQREWIDKRFDDFEDALASDNFKDTENGYRKYVDVISFIDYQIATEVSNNIDGYRLSCFLYKYRDSVDPRFKMTLWDFDNAWAISSWPETAYWTNAWTFKNNDWKNGWMGNHLLSFWFNKLMQDPSYVEELKNRYAECRQGRYADICGVIDSLTYELTAMGASDRDFKAWPRWGKLYSNLLCPESYDEEINYIKNWVNGRIAWLDEQLGYNATLIRTNGIGKDSTIEGVYSVNGVKRKSLQKGINIIKRSDGSVYKTIKSR